MQEIEITVINREAILSGQMCPYCGNETRFVDSTIVYGSSYGKIYHCAPCKAWVGVHRGTTNALGRLADDDLRYWKKEAHRCFDAIWQRKLENGFSKFNARTALYKWLSEQMGIEKQYTHIGMFNIEQCRWVIELCKNYH